MKQLLIDTLKGLGFAEGKSLFLQGTFNPAEAYPDEFVTFWTDFTADHTHFDDTVNSVEWNFTVIYYANDPSLVNTKNRTISNALRKAGFIPQGLGQDIPSDDPAFTGWAMEFICIEKL